MSPTDLLAAANRVEALLAAGKPPTREVGTGRSVGDGGRIIGDGSRAGWNYFMGDDLEHVPELKDRLTSVKTYHAMRNDAQVQGLYLGSTLPIRRYTWYIEPNGAPDSVVEHIAKSYNLPIKGKEGDPRGRMQRRFSFKNHLRHCLLAIIYGHMYFEQVGEIGPDGLWYLRKLAPRMPNSILEIMTDDDGGLKGIKQNLPPKTGTAALFQDTPDISVDRLVAYIWEQEGGNWAGRSMLRGIYKNWLLKDTVLRVGAINIERAGGVPVVTGPKGATPDELALLAQMARQFRVGEGSGGAIPNGAELNLARAAGGEDAVEYIKLMNEEMGRGWLMMFMNLGQTVSGSRNLGGNFIDFALNAQETIAGWVCDVFNEHMIEDHVDWNWGEVVDNVPLLGYSRNDDRQLAIADLVEMIDRGLIQMDDELEAWIRDEYQMPRRGDGPVRVPLYRGTSADDKPETEGAGSDSSAPSPSNTEEQEVANA